MSQPWTPWEHLVLGSEAPTAMEERMLGRLSVKGRIGALAIVATVLAALPATAPLADSRRHDHRSHSGALMGGLFGGAILGTMIWSLTRPYDPPRYIYVEPPPPYYIPPPVSPYPPVPVYPQLEVYTPAPVPPPLTTAQRLEELQKVCDRGLMTKMECDAKRKMIIEGL